MSSFAGIFTLDPNAKLPVQATEAIRDNLSRRDDAVDIYSDRRCLLAKINVGAFDDLGLHSTGDACTVALAGELLYEPDKRQQHPRAADIDAIAPELQKRRVEALRDCVGTFAAALYDQSKKLLILATDICGVRSLYYHIGKNYLVFSTNLRLMELLDVVPKRMDIRGTSEEIAFGLPLDNRTPYADISILRNGEALVCNDGDVEIQRYHSWEEHAGKTVDDVEPLLDEAYDNYLSAVACRSWRDDTSISFLSGGLDSRCGVSALRTLGKRVTTICFAEPGLQDSTLAEQVSKALGTEHLCLDVDLGASTLKLEGEMPGQIDWSKFAIEKPRYSQLLFSGDGGSVGWGYVYMYDEVVAAMRRGDHEAAAKEFIARMGCVVGGSVLLSEIRDDVVKIPFEGLLAELADKEGIEPGRKFHLLLVNNDVRRHAHHIYENVDKYRIEMMTPFYDPRVLRCILKAPVDLCMKHGYYYRWLDRFPKSFHQVPWQSYPGHLPCPAGESDSGRYAWSLTNRERHRMASPMFKRSLQSCLSGNFPSALVSRWRLAAALGLHWTRIRNNAFLFKTYLKYRDVFAKCNGEIVHRR